MSSTAWESAAADKRARLQKSIPEEWKIKSPIEGPAIDVPDQLSVLSPSEMKITNSSAMELVVQLANGTLKSVDVTLAFCKRAALAYQLVNCVHEFFPELALAQARDLDRYFETHKKPVGPLHGLPISLKDQLRVKGTETCMGYISGLGIPDTDDSVLVALLRKAGAVFYVKTSVPQTLMVCETVNNIIGRTVNPRNPNLSCGGSSGGEGAMVGMRGGVIGVGTDIGGSIRIPSAFNSLYGIRPSHGRLPYAGMKNSMEGQETVHSVVGPMAHSAADVRLFLRSVLKQEPWQYDSKVIPLPWRDSEENIIQTKITAKDLNLAFYDFDGVVRPHPPILRGVEVVRSALEKSGHSVTPWSPYKHAFGVDLINKIYAADGSTDVYKHINASGEPAIPNIKDLLNPDLAKADVNEIWDMQLQKWQYQREYLDKWREWEEQTGKELDAIIAPVAPTAAIRHNQFRYYGYASIFNLLDLTSVVVPVTFADKTVDHKAGDYQPVNDIDRAVHAEYEPEVYHGAPVAVQIIGRRLSEERTLAIAEYIGGLLGH
ncbi:Acetamidase [Aspergillus coremiiformis]|uniref:amidase n=1 Tax=Aspergillus coremiiformis TaxID=138285 RepID=A0A5N6ZEC8_9EURO|nr:Acetamidase [Aspergillus coremiiformis]